MERTVLPGVSCSHEDQAKQRTSRKDSPARRCRRGFEEAMKQGDLDFAGYCRLAAQAMLQLAVEEEAAEFIGRTAYERLGGRRTTYRNGYKRRKVLTGEGAIQLAIPQTRNGRKRFQTAILKPFQRRSEMLDALIPQLFVKGLSPGAPGSATPLVRFCRSKEFRRPPPVAWPRPSARTLRLGEAGA